ncbi:MAG TPA: hypothetical protein PKY77_06390 [Phycisphaerae bacterium]|nr:hypothetical protein [Phycisphaerae bacterium]HRY69515.1 hypothetical protein [Phycisphaerae bacterium]HSA28181.1 hypothetical protein [Phycisphaerae bacterium]
MFTIETTIRVVERRPRIGGSVPLSCNLDDLVGCEVVLDTAGPIIYLGKLHSYDERGFWLQDADLHNSSEGHATREQYIVEAARDGIRTNRRYVFILRQAVYSLSALADVVTD